MWKSCLISGTVALLTRRLCPIRSVNRTLLLDQSWLPLRPSTVAGLKRHVRLSGHPAGLARGGGEAMARSAACGLVFAGRRIAGRRNHGWRNRGRGRLPCRPFARGSRRSGHRPFKALRKRTLAPAQAQKEPCLGRFFFRFRDLSSDSPFSATDAAIDVEKILRDAPPKVREAMIMRYGSSESWSDVAVRTATTTAAIRMSCKRYLDRIREKLGIPGTPQ